MKTDEKILQVLCLQIESREEEIKKLKWELTNAMEGFMGIAGWEHIVHPVSDSMMPNIFKISNNLVDRIRTIV